MKGEKAYKAVTKVDNRLISFFVCGKAMLEYKPGEVTKAHDWTLREGFGIFCFGNLYAARRWIKPWSDFAQIWEVEGVGRMKVPEFMADQEALSEGSVRLVPIRNMPGTVMYKAVRLLKRMV